MKKQASKKPQDRPDELRPEYDFDYAKSTPNRFADGYKAGSRVVVLDPDVAKVFTSRDSVNHALRTLLTALPSRRRRNLK